MLIRIYMYIYLFMYIYIVRFYENMFGKMVMIVIDNMFAFNNTYLGAGARYTMRALVGGCCDVRHRCRVRQRVRIRQHTYVFANIS